MADDLAAAISTQHARARWTTYLLWVCLALDVIAIGSGFMQRGLLTRIAAGEQLESGEAEANDARGHLIAIIQVCAFILTAIVWLVWLYRAYANLRLVGSKKSQFTRGWAVGYWFVPLLNLVRAYQIVVDLWIRSDTGNAADNVASLPRPQLVAAWWAAYLIAGGVGRVAASQATDAHSVTELLSVTNFDMLAEALTIVAALLAIAVVRGIDQRQQRFRGAAQSA
jgi:hypothetical protein